MDDNIWHYICYWFRINNNVRFASMGNNGGNMTREEKESLILASSHFLSEEFPKNFDKWLEQKINDYCQNNAWEPFQYYEGSEIYEHIDRLSDDFINFKKQKG